MDIGITSKLEHNYLLWLASSIKFYMVHITDRDRASIQSLVMLHGHRNIVEKIPTYLAKHTLHIKMFAQILRLSDWLRNNSEGLAEVVDKYDSYTTEEFITYYNNRRKS